MNPLYTQPTFKNVAQFFVLFSRLFVCTLPLIACHQPSPSVERDLYEPAQPSIPEGATEALLFVAKQSLWLAVPGEAPRVLIDETPIRRLSAPAFSPNHIMALHYGGEYGGDIELFIVDWSGDHFQRISVLDPDCPTQRLENLTWRADLNRFSAKVSEQQWVCEDPSPAARRTETYTIFIDPDTLEITEERQEQVFQRFTNIAEYNLEDGTGTVFLRKDRSNRPIYQWGFTLAESGEETITGEAELGSIHTDVVYQEGIGFYLLAGRDDYTLWSIDPLTGDQTNIRGYQARYSATGSQGLMSILADQGDQLLALYRDDIVHIPLNGDAPRTLAPIRLHGESNFALTPNQRWFLHVNSLKVERTDAFTGQHIAIDSQQGDEWLLNTSACQYAYGPLNMSPASNRFTLSTIGTGLTAGCPEVDGFVGPDNPNITLIFESESLSYTHLEDNRGYPPLFSPLGDRLAWFTEGEQQGCYHLQVRDLNTDEDINIDNDLCVAQEHHWVVLPAGQ